MEIFYKMYFVFIISCNENIPLDTLNIYMEQIIQDNNILLFCKNGFESNEMNIQFKVFYINLKSLLIWQKTIIHKWNSYSIEQIAEMLQYFYKSISF